MLAPSAPFGACGALQVCGSGLSSSASLAEAPVAPAPSTTVSVHGPGKGSTIVQGKGKGKSNELEKFSEFWSGMIGPPPDRTHPPKKTFLKFYFGFYLIFYQICSFFRLFGGGACGARFVWRLTSMSMESILWTYLWIYLLRTHPHSYGIISVWCCDFLEL